MAKHVLFSLVVLGNHSMVFHKSAFVNDFFFEGCVEDRSLWKRKC